MTASGIIERPSPNFDARAPGTKIDTIILHYTGMIDAATALARLADPEAKVSAHYVIDEDGTLYRMVAEDQRAWHAGVSSWRGQSDINGRSIGIELVNPGHEFGYRPFPKAQFDRLVSLAQDLLRRHPIRASRVLGHSDVAPERKSDPGELFDWKKLAECGVGLWPPAEARHSAATPPLVGEIQEKLQRFGYAIEVTSIIDDATKAVLTAFQRHFRPERIDGVPDAETASILDWLVAQARSETGAG